MISNVHNHGQSEFKQIVINDIYRIRQFPTGYFDFIVDIGANIGIFCSMMRFLHPLAKVVAIEPNRDVYTYLLQNTNMLGIEAVELALGNGKPLSFLDREGHLLTGIFVQDDQETYRSESATLGTIFRRHDLSVNDNYCLKFDCEGGEQHLLHDPEAIEIVKQSKYATLEIHFQSENTPFDFWLTYHDYDDWVRKNFKQSHNIDYHTSNKHKGYGHYSFTKK